MNLNFFYCHDFWRLQADTANDFWHRNQGRFLKLLIAWLASMKVEQLFFDARRLAIDKHVKFLEYIKVNTIQHGRKQFLPYFTWDIWPTYFARERGKIPLI